MQCSACGKKTAPGDRWCSACGTKLTKGWEKAPAQEPAQEPANMLARLKNPLVRKRLFMLGGGLCFVLALLVFFIFFLPRPHGAKKEFVRRPANLGGELTGEKPDTPAPYGKKGVEIAPDAVYGQVTFIGRGQITLKSLNTGKEYIVYVGHRTNYTPRRYPVVGEKIKVVYIDDGGKLKATQVEIRT
jgi:hypothetical protein